MQEWTIHVSSREGVRRGMAFSGFAMFERWRGVFRFLTCTCLAGRLRGLSSAGAGGCPHEFLCGAGCSACADYQPCTSIFLIHVLKEQLGHINFISFVIVSVRNCVG